MDKTKDANSEVIDKEQQLASWSKIAKPTHSIRSLLYWVGGGIIALMLVYAMSSPRSSRAKDNPVTDNHSDYQSSLNANLARLEALREHAQAAPIHRYTSRKAFNQTQPINKALIARQNAPTSMYVGPIISSGADNSMPSTREATFAGTNHNAQFANQSMTTSTIDAERIAHPDFTIVSGELLHAVLETAVNSDLPGMVRAVVSKPAYAYTGERVIIPAGSRLIGQYSSAVLQGQNRVMVMWNRVVLPSGIAVALSSPGVDGLGIAGQSANSVVTHFLARFGQAALLSVLGAGVANMGVSNQAQFNSAAQYRMAMAGSFQQSAKSSLQGTQHIKPTLHIYQGADINVFVAHDLSFYNVLKLASTQNDTLVK